MHFPTKVANHVAHSFTHPYRPDDQFNIKYAQGLTGDQAKAHGIKFKKGLFPRTSSGRAIANGGDEGATKLLFDDSPETHGHNKILSSGIVGMHAGDLISEIALAIEMSADSVDIGMTIYLHETLGESIGVALGTAHRSCTDVCIGRGR